MTSVDAQQPLFSRHGRPVSSRHRVQVFLEDASLEGERSKFTKAAESIHEVKVLNALIATSFLGTITDSGSTTFLTATRR